MKRMTVVIPDDLAIALEQERRRQDTSASGVVRMALEVFLVEPQREALVGMIGLFDTPENDLADRAESILDSDWGSWIARDSGLSASYNEPEPVLAVPDGSSAGQGADASSA